ncbi:unnamed protein product [Phytophthora fragariaefolia]|uniref:Unnamed protein product n=1 Tax=Phytophthora fragariaefolia TaxID=1490495 RepID=A0A9W7D761_9STRA|nr:unnamed protein product [Phytophthora fragariaefolia]
MAEEALREEESCSEGAARMTHVAEFRTRSERSRALSLAREGRAVAGLAHAKDSGAAGATEDMEETAAPKKCSASQVDDDNDDEAEGAGEASSQGDSNSSEGSGADKMSRDGDERQEEDEDEEEDDEKTEDVIVPAFQSDHKTWPLFKESLREYMRRTRQVFVVKENINIKRRNDALCAQTRYQGLPDEQIPLIPEEMNPYQRKFICTHAWPERERSTGARKAHKLRRTDCPFQFLAQVVGTKGITLKREFYRHNHRISREIYSSYPGIR